MSKNLLAISVVLLPSTADMEKIIALIDYSTATETKLTTDDCLPHLTLAMGTLAEAEQTVAAELLTSIASETAPLEVTIDAAQEVLIPDGKKPWSADVVKTAPLVALHKKVLTAFEPHIAGRTATVDMFYPNPPVAQVTPFWVNNYYDTHPQNFQPHFTLGEGTVNLEKPLTITIDTIGLTQLGSYCTCRNVLTSETLRATN